ncbi:hypothetical protein JCM21714_747 [Gracilibacillus boraciitolerans JCM 21714]|uniref:Uncharacterized protein n=1 Tax=Gracilibacillus boraciitolerans JCM 21714 TaxID=1298598 RepID=W4VEG1_9BACI|nr:hypothetical protein [Gracilibacillus boraciitolerans]GAE91790.1 hypothetical protein JCM21714_747 [Gracilibacillus boraciitolerans JCM 21714]
MRKRNILSLAGAAGVATLSYMLKDKSRRDNVKNKFNNIKKSFKKQDTGLPIEEAGGDPGKDNIENADMVAEGSQFGGVNYYNKVKNEELFK